MRTRLRPAWADAELAGIYARPHDHRMYGYGHDLRVRATIPLAQWVVLECGATSVADLSCGNAAIVTALGLPQTWLGDYAPGYQFTGPVEQTIHEIPQVDMFICSETVEHLNDPDAVLAQIRSKARRLILSTPIGEDDLGNPEHYWGWDHDGVAEMLTTARWSPMARYDVILSDTYSYQIWACQ